jgi:hypothetical protein
MDQIMVDVSHVDHVNVGEEAVLLASQGGETILASPELTTKADRRLLIRGLPVSVSLAHLRRHSSTREDRICPDSVGIS